MARLYSLTTEHRAQLKPWAKRWRSNAMSTAAMTDEDRAACVEAVHGLYAAAKLPPPKHIVFVPSPFVLAFAGGFAAGIWHLSKTGEAATGAATWDATRAATEAATGAATRAATEAATWAATWDATEAATWAATEAATRAATEAATWDATWAATGAATRAATRAATEAATWDATWDDLKHWWIFPLGEMRSLAERIGRAEYMLGCAASAWRMWQGGNQWSGYDSFLSFFQDVAQLPLDYSAYRHWRALAERSGPRIVHPDFCMISDRPERLLVDDQNRPHCDDGPFCRWRDGAALYSVHGVRVPAWLIERPERLSWKLIATEQNAEVKRVMIERYGVARYVADAGGKVLDQCPADHPLLGLRGARLLSLPTESYEQPLTVIELVNSTPEPDGHCKLYHLSVNPAHYNGRAGKDCLAAVASTWRDPDDGSLIFAQPEDYLATAAES